MKREDEEDDDGGGGDRRGEGQGQHSLLFLNLCFDEICNHRRVVTCWIKCIMIMI